MSSTPQRESVKTKRKQEGQKREMRAATSCYTVVMCAAQTLSAANKQKKQTKFSFENHIYDLHGMEPAHCTGHGRFVLIRSNALLSFK